jgi:hypothetical protein
VGSAQRKIDKGWGAALITVRYGGALNVDLARKRSTKSLGVILGVVLINMLEISSVNSNLD